MLASLQYQEQAIRERTGFPSYHLLLYFFCGCRRRAKATVQLYNQLSNSAYAQTAASESYLANTDMLLSILLSQKKPNPKKMGG